MMFPCFQNTSKDPAAVFKHCLFHHGTTGSSAVKGQRTCPHAELLVWNSSKLKRLMDTKGRLSTCGFPLLAQVAGPKFWEWVCLIQFVVQETRLGKQECVISRWCFRAAHSFSESLHSGPGTTRGAKSIVECVCKQHSIAPKLTQYLLQLALNSWVSVLQVLVIQSSASVGSA